MYLPSWIVKIILKETSAVFDNQTKQLKSVFLCNEMVWWVLTKQIVVGCFVPWWVTKRDSFLIKTLEF
jgi:hypothetical protein